MSGVPKPRILQPPITADSSIPVCEPHRFPASFWYNDTLLDPRTSPLAFLEHDLRTNKIDAIHTRLWLTGLTRQARSLHRQRLLGRTIRLTESPNEHLVWHKHNIFIKPLPAYLLDHAFWSSHLCVDKQLYGCATGLLLSYVWLVASTSDFTIAIEERIFPSTMTWEAWQTIVSDVLQNMGTLMASVDRRYHYGELRLSRLNTLYRFNVSTFSPRNLVNGFMTTPTWYTQFFEKNFSWILAAFIYITVVLSAMQVGLATTQLQDNVQFHNLSYGIAISAIAVVAFVVLAMFFVWFVLFWFHLCSTIRHSKRAVAKRCSTQETYG